MLEILLLIFLSKKIGGIARNKGRSGGGYIALLIFLWIGGEITGALIGAFATADSSNQCVVYIMALFGAAAGALIAFTVASAMSPKPGYPKPAVIPQPAQPYPAQPLPPQQEYPQTPSNYPPQPPVVPPPTDLPRP